MFASSSLESYLRIADLEREKALLEYSKQNLEASVQRLEASNRAFGENQTKWLAYQKDMEAKFILSKSQTQVEMDARLEANRVLVEVRGKLEAAQKREVTLQLNEGIASRTLPDVKGKLEASLKREAATALTLSKTVATSTLLVESMMRENEVLRGEKEALWRRPFRMPFAGESDPWSSDSVLSHCSGALLPFFTAGETLMLRGVCREFKGVVWEMLTTGGGGKTGLPVRSEAPIIKKIMVGVGKGGKDFTKEPLPPSYNDWKSSDLKQFFKKG